MQATAIAGSARFACRRARANGPLRFAAGLEGIGRSQRAKKQSAVRPAHSKTDAQRTLWSAVTWHRFALRSPSHNQLKRNAQPEGNYRRTGRAMHTNKRGRINPEHPLILDRLGLTDRNWTTQVKATQSEFYRAIGAAESLIGYPKQIGQHWMQSPPSTRSGGIGVARELFKMRPKPG